MTSPLVWALDCRWHSPPAHDTSHEFIQPCWDVGPATGGGEGLSPQNYDHRTHIFTLSCSTWEGFFLFPFQCIALGSERLPFLPTSHTAGGRDAWAGWTHVLPPFVSEPRSHMTGPTQDLHHILTCPQAPRHPHPDRVSLSHNHT